MIPVLAEEPGEPCDGFDNDGDGTVDEGCDQFCDQPENLGPENRVGTVSGFASNPMLVWTGSEYGLAWDDHSYGSIWRAIFARLDATGARIGTFHYITATVQSMDPSLVFSGSGYGVAWDDNRDGHGGIYFTRIDPSGEPVGPETKVPGYTPMAPSLVWTGTEYGLAMLDIHPQYGGISFVRLDAEGGLLGSVVQVFPGSYSGFPSLAWSGTGYGVAWSYPGLYDKEIYFTRLNALGINIGPTLRVTNASADSMDPQLAWTGTEFGLAWVELRDGNPEIYFARISAAGDKIGSDIRVTQNAADSWSPTLVWNGSEYGLAWQESRDGNPEVYFARLDASGNKLGSEVRVTNDPGTSVGPALRWNGVDFGLAWIDGRLGEVPYFTRLSCCDEMDLDGANECHDCDDGNPAIFPGAEQICGDGLNNDCNHPGWPALAGTNEVDDDGDGQTECQGDCDDARASVYAGALQACDGVNNDCGDSSWPVVPADEADLDADVYRLCSGECDDADPDIHPNAAEINDGKDNQCPPEPGYGIIDEVSGDLLFGNPADSGEICWPAQAGATAYEAVRSPSPAFPPVCDLQSTSVTCWSDPDVPGPGEVFYYLVRPVTPGMGSWGQQSSGAERMGLCGEETDCTDGVDNDGDGWTDCDDPGCYLAPECAAPAFAFTDTLGDDITPSALSDFFTATPAAPTDYLFFSLSGTGLTRFSWCAERADFYRDSYLAMALSGGTVMSGSWNRWTLQEGGSWTGPDTSGYPNQFGIDCMEDHAWCAEFGLAGRYGAVLPAQANECEAFDYPICGTGDSTLVIKVGTSRLLACGF